MQDDPQIQDPKLFLESLDDHSFNNFARGYLHGMSVRLRRYEQLLGVKFQT